jgi:hypothetical protein
MQFLHWLLAGEIGAACRPYQAAEAVTVGDVAAPTIAASPSSVAATAWTTAAMRTEA